MIQLDNVPTGIISDTHFPGHVDGALDFVLRTGEKWGVQQWIHIGDVVDYHYISRHPTEPDADSPIVEYNKAKAEIRKWYYAIPQMTICRGNHDNIPLRQLKTLGIPELFLRDFNEIYGTPGWTWTDNIKLFNNTLVDHGEGSGGMYGAKNTANKLGCSYIQGHVHAYGTVFNLPRPFLDAAALNVGCLMDENKYFARYGKRFKVPVSLGMGICLGDDEMYFIKYRG